MRPNVKARQEFERLFPGQNELTPIPSIHRWRKEHVLAEANVLSSKRSFVCVEDLKIRHQLELERSLANLMIHHKISHLNISDVRSKNRHLTRAISRIIYENWDCAGIEFRSNLNGGNCYALFEERSKLHQIGKSINLEEDIPLLIKVCKDYGLRMGPNERFS